MNKPVYDFLGYELNNCILNRNSKIANQIVVKVLKSSFDEKSRIYTLTVNVLIYFESSKESKLEFSIKFMINDTSWYNSVKHENLISLFMSTSFPYVRQMVNSITNDTRGPLVIPTLDLRGIDLEKGIILKKS